VSYLGKKPLSRSSKKRTKRTAKASRAVGYTLVTWVILAASFVSFNALAETVAPVTYQATSTQVVSISTSSPISTPSVVVEKPESLHDKITRYAAKYNIPREDMRSLIECEVGVMFNPKTRSQGILKSGKQERSYGLAQINLDAHDVTIAQATDPDFALDWLGSHWEKRHSMYVNCMKKLKI